MTVKKQTCPVCNREIDARGMSGHMRTHTSPPKGSGHPKNSGVKESEGAGDDGVISYPSNEQKDENSPDIEDSGMVSSSVRDDKPGLAQANQGNVPDSTTTKTKKQVKKPVASNPVSNATSKPVGNDTRGTRKPDEQLKEEYQGLFR